MGCGQPPCSPSSFGIRGILQQTFLSSRQKDEEVQDFRKEMWDLQKEQVMSLQEDCETLLFPGVFGG